MIDFKVNQSYIFQKDDDVLNMIVTDPENNKQFCVQLGKPFTLKELAAALKLLADKCDRSAK